MAKKNNIQAADRTPTPPDPLDQKPLAHPALAHPILEHPALEHPALERLASPAPLRPALPAEKHPHRPQGLLDRTRDPAEMQRPSSRARTWIDDQAILHRPRL
jgi:hypothetical protein